MAEASPARNPKCRGPGVDFIFEHRANIERVGTVVAVQDQDNPQLTNRLPYIAGPPIDLRLSLSRWPPEGLRQNRMLGRFSLRSSE